MSNNACMVIKNRFVVKFDDLEIWGRNIPRILCFLLLKVASLAIFSIFIEIICWDNRLIGNFHVIIR